MFVSLVLQLFPAFVEAFGKQYSIKSSTDWTDLLEDFKVIFSEKTDARVVQIPIMGLATVYPAMVMLHRGRVSSELPERSAVILPALHCRTYVSRRGRPDRCELCHYFVYMLPITSMDKIITNQPVESNIAVHLSEL